ncbi:STAS domain-containing protein [Streptomyces sp. GD-15H]|uniref:STAS domain-containing protein n=1 Tax=Streptomyces sp. GD-15H TaxID=3129112 RepID=UPI003256235A
MALFLASHWENGWAVMEIKGALDATTARELCDFVAAVTAQHRHLLNLIVDLSELTWADADGLGALLSVRALLDEDQGELRLVCPEGRVERILRSSGLAQALSVHPSLDAALAAPRTTPADRPGGAVQ